MTFLLYGKPVSKIMKTVIDFLKILPDTAPFPNFDGEKIFNTTAYIEKIKSITAYHF
jgi:hypothetical protein